MGNKTYNRLKWIALVLLPALATLYFGLGQIWHFPAIEQVMASITVVDTFLGLVLGTSSRKYQTLTDSPTVMGELVVVQDYDGTPLTVRVEPNERVPVFEEGKLAAFKVRREPLE
jgi:hypothetical protein